jgi:hypothetical protein
MPLESATYIDGLVTTNPAASDAISTADDHLRLIKSAIKATFPNITAPVTKTAAEINTLAPLASPTFTGTPAAPTAAAGTNTTQLASTAFVKAAVDAAIAAAAQGLYPVGSIYINATNATNPATLLGFGTWVAFGAGRVPVGFNASDPLFDTAEETGGSKDATVVSHTHTGTTASNGAHSHEVQAQRVAIAYNAGGSEGTLGGVQPNTLSPVPTTQSAGAHTHTFTTDSTGSSGTNANLQPYITVYMWKRTA